MYSRAASWHFTGHGARLTGGFGATTGRRYRHESGPAAGGVLLRGSRLQIDSSLMSYI